MRLTSSKYLRTSSLNLKLDVLIKKGVLSTSFRSLPVKTRAFPSPASPAQSSLIDMPAKGGHVHKKSPSVPELLMSDSSKIPSSSRLHFSKFAERSLIFEKSGVGEVLRCEFADEGQELLTEQYPEELVVVRAEVLLDQE